MTAEQILYAFTNYITDTAVLTTFKYILILVISCFILGGLFRLLFGKRRPPAQAMAAIPGIFILYCTIFLLQNSSLSVYTPPLPFVQLEVNFITLFPITTADRSLLCTELVHLVLLATAFGLIDDVLSHGKNFIVWLLLRCITLLVAFTGYFLMIGLLESMLPNAVVTYAPMILIGLLAIFLAVTVFKWLIGLILGASGGPILGAIYTFFVSNFVGRQLSKAAFITGFLCLATYLGNIYTSSQLVYTIPIIAVIIPIILLLSIVWYLLHKVY